MERSKFNISFTTENMEEFIKQFNNQKDLLPIYLDKIRNGYDFTEEMIQNIENFDNTSKMKLIREFIACIKILNETIKSM